MTNFTQHLTHFLADVLETEARLVAPDLTFEEQGMDSLNGMRFARKIQDLLGREIELECLFDYPTITQLASFLASDTGGHAAHGAARTATQEAAA